MRVKISTREEYEMCRSRGIEPLTHRSFEIDHKLRVRLQKEFFGKNDAEGNEKFYKFCLATKTMVCEECGKPILHPGAVNVSHILTRGAHPDLAHDPRNINILCFAHHQMWENGDRKSMRIYPINERKINKLKKEYQ